MFQEVQHLNKQTENPSALQPGFYIVHLVPGRLAGKEPSEQMSQSSCFHFFWTGTEFSDC